MFAHITWHTWNRVGCVDVRAAREVRVAVLSAGKRTGVQVIKGEVLAETRANRLVFGAVKWARGYYVTTLHKNDVPRVQRYIERQFERHPNLIPRGSRSSDPGRQPGVNQ